MRAKMPANVSKLNCTALQFSAQCNAVQLVAVAHGAWERDTFFGVLQGSHETSHFFEMDIHFLPEVLFFSIWSSRQTRSCVFFVHSCRYSSTCNVDTIYDSYNIINTECNLNA